MPDCDEAWLDEKVVAAPSAAKKQNKKRKHAPTAVAKKETTAAAVTPPVAKKKQTSKPKASREGPPKSPVTSYLLTGEVPSADFRNPWDDTACVQWTQQASVSIRNVFKQDMLFVT